MVSKITREQLDELEDILSFDGREAFNEKLQELTGIEAKQYIAYQYYNGADYLGDSNDYTVKEILESAYIMIGSDNNDAE